MDYCSDLSLSNFKYLVEIMNHSCFTQDVFGTEWDCKTKSAITKLYFPKIADRLKLKINVTPNFTTLVTGHGNIRSYLYKYKIIDSPTCSCKKRRTDNRPHHIWLWTGGAG